MRKLAPSLVIVLGIIGEVGQNPQNTDVNSENLIGNEKIQYSVECG